MYQNFPKALGLWLAFLAINFPLLAQYNLVPNPSFEEYKEYPCSWTLDTDPLENYLMAWTMPSRGSTDPFSTKVEKYCYCHCFSENSSSPGMQLPRTGESMAAILTYGEGCSQDYREYLQVELQEPLIVGHVYQVEFFVSLADNSQVASNNLGVYFSEQEVYESTCRYLELEPQLNHLDVVSEQEGWVPIRWTFIPEKPVRFMIIGNFYSNADTETTEMTGFKKNCRFFVDDVLVMPMLAQLPGGWLRTSSTHTLYQH